MARLFRPRPSSRRFARLAWPGCALDGRSHGAPALGCRRQMWVRSGKAPIEHGRSVVPRQRTGTRAVRVRSPVCLFISTRHCVSGRGAMVSDPEGLTPARQLWSSGSGGRGKNSMPSSAQGLGLLACGLAVDAARRRLLVVDLARLLGKARADVLRLGPRPPPASCAWRRPARRGRRGGASRWAAGAGGAGRRRLGGLLSASARLRPAPWRCWASSAPSRPWSSRSADS